MKKLLLLPLLALALFAGSAVAPKNALAVCPGVPQQSTIGAFSASEAPACGGSVCQFDLRVWDATTVYPCGHPGIYWRYMVYSRDGFLPCTNAGFVHGYQDHRCNSAVSNLQVIALSYANNDPILANFGGCGVPCPVHMWGYVQS